MAIKPPVGGEGAFDVDGVAGADLTEIRLGDRFSRKKNLKSLLVGGRAVAVAVDVVTTVAVNIAVGFDREADTADTDRLSVCKIGKPRGANSEAAAVGVRVDSDDLAGGFDDSGEHTGERRSGRIAVVSARQPACFYRCWQYQGQMQLGILDLLGLATTLVFAIPVANFGVTKLLAGEAVVGAALLGVGVAMVILPHYALDPKRILVGLLPARLRGAAGTDDQPER